MALPRPWGTKNELQILVMGEPNNEVIGPRAMHHHMLWRNGEALLKLVEHHRWGHRRPGADDQSEERKGQSLLRRLDNRCARNHDEAEQRCSSPRARRHMTRGSSTRLSREHVGGRRWCIRTVERRALNGAKPSASLLVEGVHVGARG